MTETLSFPMPGPEYSNPRNPRLRDAETLLVDFDVVEESQVPPYVAVLLARPNRAVPVGAQTKQFRRDNCGDLFLLDGRESWFYYDTDDGNAAPVSIGKGSKAESPAVVWPTVTGRIPRDAPWQTVKDKWDAAGVRLEGLGTLYVYGGRIENLEDGIEPHPAADPNGNLSNRFSIESVYMEHIRDDAIENDQGMSGFIGDVFVEGCNRFLSEQVDSQNIHNPFSVVTIERCLVHQYAMPNARAKDGKGYGGTFKWQGDAGRVAVKDCIFLLDEPPIADNAWPRGTYEDVTVILGPQYPAGPRPSYLPSSVTVTRDLGLWDDARDEWVMAHPEWFA